jgi:O-methyltransferase
MFPALKKTPAMAAFSAEFISFSQQTAGNMPIVANTARLSVFLTGKGGVGMASIGQTDSEAAYEPGRFVMPMPSPRPDHSCRMEGETAGRAIGKTFFVWLAKLVFGVGLVISFVFGSAGRQYGIGPLTRLWLAARVILNNRRLRPLSTSRQHLLMIEQILRVPKSVPGDVVECGCFNGASTANLSLACALTKRRLFVCDSFEGLPSPEEEERHIINTRNSYYQWREGDYKSDGGLEGVKKRIERFGRIEVCRFVKGYFEQTLRDLECESIVLVFEDADLPSSVRQCLLHLWPKLQVDCRFYSHEPWSVEVVSLFYDEPFWREHFGTSPPGFFGAAVGGLAAEIVHATIGYAEKWDPSQIIRYGKADTDPGLKTRAAA